MLCRGAMAEALILDRLGDKHQESSSVTSLPALELCRVRRQRDELLQHLKQRLIAVYIEAGW